MVILYNDSLREARILAREGDRMRIAVEHCDDAVELSLVDGIWLSEERQPISFELLWAEEIPLVVPVNRHQHHPPADLLSRYAVGNASRC
ncbi:MAG TPA: hypothetical protein VKR61_06025 [Bryobacteraceae bacterium]|nr:hypothetical protein [Bryobacteraceae bacterium]